MSLEEKGGPKERGLILRSGRREVSVGGKKGIDSRKHENQQKKKKGGGAAAIKKLQ